MKFINRLGLTGIGTILLFLFILVVSLDMVGDQPDCDRAPYNYMDTFKVTLTLFGIWALGYFTRVENEEQE